MTCPHGFIACRSDNPHWHVKPCKHNNWPQMFCEKCKVEAREKARQILNAAPKSNVGDK